MSEHLVVASKIKKHIKQNAGMNTSASVLDELTKIVEQEIDKAVKNAQRDNRKTLMDRDFNQSNPL